MSRGYYRASMDDIATLAGVTKPVLYHHFSSKLGLYLALIDRQNEKLLSHISAALAAPAETPYERVRATVAAYFEYVECGDSAFRLIFDHDAARDIQVRERLERSAAQCAAIIGEVIASVTPLPRAQTELLGRALAGMAQLTARARLEEPSGVTSSEAVDLVAGLAWHGLKRLPTVE